MDVNQILLVIAALAAVGTLAGLAVGRSLLWQVSLVVTILAFCTGRLLPPDETLKFGLDLQGGTSLLYEVSVPEGMNDEQAIQQTIETLKRRVDPEGLRNLEWHQETGNRIEVRMPRPSAEVQARREALNEIVDRIQQGNVTRQEILNAVSAPEERRHELYQTLADRLTAESADLQNDKREQRIDLLRELAEVRDQYQSLKTLYEREPEDSERRLELAGRVAEAERAYDQAFAAVMATNVRMGELQQAMELPAHPEDPLKLSKQQKRAIQQLKEAHPVRADEIDTYAQAYLAYEEKKGPLDDPEDLKRLMRGAGVLNFRLTVNPDEDNIANLEDIRKQFQEKGPSSFEGGRFVWVRIDDLSMFAKSQSDREAAKQSTAQYFRQRGGYVAERFGEDIYMLCWDTPDKSITQRPSQEGWKIDNVRPQPDPRTYFPAVGVELNTAGGRLMSKLTQEYTGRPMAMILDGSLLSAPTINSPFGSSFLISGGQNGFSPTEQQYLIRTLGAGSLLAQVSPEPIAVRTVGPSLGEDNLERGLQSALYALVGVGIFMMVYYLFSGAVAAFAVVGNLVIVLGVMATPFFTGGASFTLPGIAGIVLTIGMCVDANVLIFERIREELIRGADADTATRLGYQRAFSSIIDSNITNLIVCVILYQTATVEVRGFAVTLGIGIVATLITSLFMTRVIFRLWGRLFSLNKSMSQLPTVMPVIDRVLTPRIAWLGKRYAFFAISFVALVASLFMVVDRGANLLDIEFRGGTEVAFELAEGESLTLDEARSRRSQIAELYAADPSELSGKEAEISRWLREMVEHRRNEVFRTRLDKLKAEGQDPDPEALRQQIRSATELSRMKDATVVSIGDPVSTDESDAKAYAAFSLVSTVEDQQVVSAAVKREYSDVLDVQGRLNFDSEEVEDVAAAPVYPIDQEELGQVIGRNVAHDVSAHRGGVAIVVSGIDPPETIKSIRQRLRSMRLQPDFEDMAFREWEVLGVENAPGEVSKYTAVAVVVSDPRISYFSDPGAWDAMAQAEWELVREALTRDTSLSKVSNFTPTVARTLRDKAIVALALSFFAIIAYIWFRFGSLRYGLAAIAAIVHDVIIALGCVAATHFLYDKAVGEALLLSEFKLNLGLIAALLTIVGYSLNDTIVLFDRIRENRGKLAYASTAVINRSINQTISRTMLTSVTTLLAVGVLYIYGGDAIRGFAFALILGVLVGTYSSIAIAAPLVGMGVGSGHRAEPEPAERRPEPAGQPEPAGA